MSSEKQEVWEALEAGKRALYSLTEAKNSLSTARGFGVWDMLGGGLGAGIFKHAKINDASRQVEAAKSDLRRFQKELSDVNMACNLNMDVGEFLTFADFFFDGFLADVLVQSKMKDMAKQLDEAIGQVKHMVNELEQIYARY